jgi:thymidylate synthase (FAD)
MRVKLIAITQYLAHDVKADDPSGSEALIEHAGRICYRSEDSDQAEGRARFIQRRVTEGHESIIEHANASFEISGISRACSHQLVRHRLASYSQESQRYVDMSDPEWVVPADVASDPEAMALWSEFAEFSRNAYRRLLEKGVKRQDARFLLPNATATRLIMTANFRELLHVFRLRISPQAQWEIRELSVRMLEAVYPFAPNVFGPLRSQLRASYPSFFAAVDNSEGNGERTP